MFDLDDLATEYAEKMLDNGWDSDDVRLVRSHLGSFLMDLRKKMADTGTVFYQP